MVQIGGNEKSKEGTYISSNSRHGACKVAGEVVSVSLREDLSVEDSWLLVVVIGVIVDVSSSHARDGGGRPLLGWVFNWPVQGVGLIVRSSSLVSVYPHGAIALIVSNSGPVGAVNGNLLIVGAESVAVGIRVREQSALEHPVI